jgi:hypothetical protein
MISSAVAECPGETRPSRHQHDLTVPYGLEFLPPHQFGLWRERRLHQRFIIADLA